MFLSTCRRSFWSRLLEARRRSWMGKSLRIFTHFDLIWLKSDWPDSNLFWYPKIPWQRDTESISMHIWTSPGQFWKDVLCQRRNWLRPSIGVQMWAPFAYRSSLKRRMEAASATGNMFPLDVFVGTIWSKMSNYLTWQYMFCIVWFLLTPSYICKFLHRLWHSSFRHHPSEQINGAVGGCSSRTTQATCSKRPPCTLQATWGCSLAWQASSRSGSGELQKLKSYTVLL